MNSDFVRPHKETTYLQAPLDEIERAGLARRLDESEWAYVFKHSLIQETTYSSLLKSDRKRLHGWVGDAIERAYPERLDELSPVLARHFEEAGDPTRALSYLRRAGDRAVRAFANAEALEFYSRAIALAGQTSSAAAELYRMRGQVYERLGEFDRARADLEHALTLARAAHDRRTEWEALINLGFLWSARDYERAGSYFRQALEQARTLDDPAALAHSLNRVGNWYLNTEQPLQALVYHREALDTFEFLGDKRGMAETHDLLGMTNVLSSDLSVGLEHYRQALALYRELDNRQGIITSLLTMRIRGATLQSDTVPLVHAELGDLEQSIAETRQLAREIGWRAGESYTHWLIAFTYGAQGKYRQALNEARRGLNVAEAIDHRQWMAAARTALGAVESGMLAFEAAQRDLETALGLAVETGSLHWRRTATGLLASVYLALEQPDRAQAVLDAVLPPDAPARTLGQRQCYMARVELALARRDPTGALSLLDRMTADLPNLDPGAVIPRLAYLRAQAHRQLEQWDTAAELLTSAIAASEAEGTRPLLWRIHVEACRVEQARGNVEQAQAHAAAARRIMTALVDEIDDPALREQFRRRAENMLAAEGW